MGHGGQGFGIRIPGFGSKVLKVEVSGARLACGRQASQACTDCTFDVGINVRFGVNVFFCACVCVCVCVCVFVCVFSIGAQRYRLCCGLGLGESAFNKTFLGNSRGR